MSRMIEKMQKEECKECFMEDFMEGFTEGFMEGFVKGFRKGVEEATRMAALHMLSDGTLGLEEIAECTGLTLAEVKSLQLEEGT